MIGMNLKSIKGSFFDAPAVMRAVDKATRDVLSKFGAFVRTRAQQSIKKGPFSGRKKRGQARTSFRRKNSQPGNPPYSQTGLLKKFIWFGYYSDRQSVVIGPVRLNSKTGDALPALEYGGMATIRRNRREPCVRVQVKARPFMGPAFEAVLPKLPAMWANSVKGE